MDTKVETEMEWFAHHVAQGRYHVHAAPCLLTVDMAHELIARNPDNRHVSQRRVEIYANDIRADRWAENGETIVVSRDGLLNDGQHRCHAVIMAGMAIPAIIVFGVERDSRTTTNQGKTKGAGDYAGMRGIANANNIAAIARLSIAFDQGMAIETSRVSHSAVLEYITENHDELAEAWRKVEKYRERLKVLCSPSTVAFCYMACARVNRDAADEYFQQLCSGEGLLAGDPALVVRNKLMQVGKARGPKIETIFHGWNAFRRGGQRTLIRITGNLPALA